MKPATLPEPLLTIEEASAKFRVCRSYLYQRAGAQDFPSYRLGKRIYFYPPDLESWLCRKGKREAVK